jgi:putative ubiquitin-RnfH superfamily antitoxin RatB of RatAB toxin-antitoxin module
MAAAEGGGEAIGTPLRVVVVLCAGPHLVDETALSLPAGSTLADALSRSGITQRHPASVDWTAGVWGRAQVLGASLRDGDRVEVYRPLTVDPKEARRQRYGLHKDKLKAHQLKVAARHQ